ncbi:hypothetical protein [Haloprofundus halophilus]|uniref:hypothetical protein n=1 Tax=Haloprofundus halophilus TaxID=2283527 RepID=UPI000E43665F|nr:hypothetical protein [Haloprofundus halophilus]
MDSFRYAFRRELILLYVAIFAGRWVMAFSQDGLFIIPRGILRTLITFPIYVLGLALVVGGAVGVFHHIISDLT